MLLPKEYSLLFEALESTITTFHTEPTSPEFEELELLLILVKDYEDKNIVIR